MRWVRMAGLLILGLAILPPDPEGAMVASWIRAGDRLWAEGRGLSARRFYEMALARRPEDPRVLHRVARLRGALGEGEEAEALWRAAMRQGDPTALRGLAEVATQRRDWPTAWARWQAWAARAPEDREAFARWAEAALASGAADAARAAWEVWLERHPEDAAARFRLGLLLGALDPEAARRHLTGLPPPADAWAARLPPFCALEARCPQAEEAEALRRWAFTLVGARYWGEARLALDRWLAVHPEDPVAMAAMGYTLGRLGADGTPWLQRAAARSTIPPEVHYFWGLYLLEHGHYREAMGRFAAAWHLRPDPLFALERGRAAMLAGDLLTAERWLREAVRADPDNVEGWNMLAALYLGHQVREGEGSAAAREILQRAPERAEGYEWLGWAHYLREDFAGAERLLRQALAQDAVRPSAHYRLGIVLAAQGRAAEARRWLEQTVLLDPQGEFGRRAQRWLSILPPSGD